MGYVHRDVKPDNILIGADGHTKLADFGTCIQTDDKGRVRSKGVIGTADYIPPEVIETQDGGGTYGVQADWWSVGVVTYELILGEAPFFTESLHGTFNKIQTHNPDTMDFPSDVTWSDTVKDFIKSLLTSKKSRLGSGADGVEEIKRHQFFAGLDFANLRAMTPPIIPEIGAPESAMNFPDVDQKAPKPPETFKTSRKFEGNQLPFVGFTTEVPGRAAGPGDAAVVPAETEAASGPSSTEIQTITDDNIKLRLEINALKAEMATLVDSRDQLQTEVASQATKFDAQREDDTARLEKQLAQEQKDLAQARVEISSLNAQVNKLEYERNAAPKAAPPPTPKRSNEEEILKRRVASLENSLSSANGERDQALSSVTALKQQLSDERKKTTEVKRGKAESAAIIAELQAAASDDSKAADAAKRAQRAAELEVETLTDRNKDLKRKAKRAAEELAELEDHQRSIHKTSASLKVKLAASENEKASLEADIDTLRGRYEAAVKKLKTKTAQIAKLEAAGAEAVAGQTNNEQQLREQLQAESARRSASEDEADKLRGFEAELRLEVSRLTSELASVADLQTALQDAESRVEEETALKRVLNEKLAKVEEDFAGASASIVKLRARVEEELANNVDLVQDLAERDDKISGLTASLETAEERIDELSNEVNIRTAQLEEKSARLKAQATELSKITSELSQDETIDRMREELEAAQSAASAREESMAQADKRLQLLEAELAFANQNVSMENERYVQLRSKYDELVKQHGATADAIKEYKRMTRSSTVELAEAVSFRDQFQMKYNFVQSEVERLKRELAAKDAKLEVSEAQLLQSKKAFQEMHRRSSADMSAPRATNTRAQKQIKQHQQQIQQIQQELDNAVRRHKAELERIEAEHKDEVEKMEVEAVEKDEMYETQIAAFKHSLSKRISENERMQKNVARISRVCEEETVHDPGLVRSPPLRSIRQALTEVDAMDGWLSVPKKDNIRKYGWEPRYCTMDSETFSVFFHEGGSEPAVITLSVKHIHHAKAVRQDELIHAKSSDLPKIFQITVITGIESSACPKVPMTPRRSVASAAAAASSMSVPPHNVLPGGSMGSDEYEFLGHCFEKMPKTSSDMCAVCRKTVSGGMTLGLGRKNPGYKCKRCGLVTHLRHILANDAGVKWCQGESPFKTYNFMAESAESQQQWIEHLMGVVRRRGAAAVLAPAAAAASKPSAAPSPDLSRLGLRGIPIEGPTRSSSVGASDNLRASADMLKRATSGGGQ